MARRLALLLVFSLLACSTPAKERSLRDFDVEVSQAAAIGDPRPPDPAPGAGFDDRGDGDVRGCRENLFPADTAAEIRARWKSAFEAVESAGIPQVRTPYAFSKSLGAPADGTNGLEDGAAAGFDDLLVVERADGSPTPLSLGTGSLLAKDADGRRLRLLPLGKTTVRADVTFFLAATTVTQRFTNCLERTVEADYLFPLPATAAVTDFVMMIGDRRIRGVVREREEARRIYEAARAAGRRASLLTQGRPNVFTESVANLAPGESIDVTIDYFHTLPRDGDDYEYVFPMVVAPRFSPNPGPEADAVARPGDPEPDRPGDDVSITVAVDAGVRIEAIDCPSHEVTIERPAAERALVALAPRDRIPNRDFVLRYRVAGDGPKAALLCHRGDRGGFFGLLLAAPVERRPATGPRELVFVVDRSGSMKGAPLAQSKAVMRRLLGSLTPADSFRIVAFSDGSAELAAAALPATPENVARGLDYVDGLTADGGTVMRDAVRAALAPAPDPERARVVCLLTDGQVDDEAEILADVRELRRGARVFAVGVDESPNRHLLGEVAREGGALVHYILPDEDPDAAAARVAPRLGEPALAGVAIDWGGVPVEDVAPAELPDLYPGQALLLVGRYRGGRETEVTVSGWAPGGRFERRLPVAFPDWEAANAVLASVWARRRIGSLMRVDLPATTEETARQVTDLALEFRLASAFTSFVATEE